MAKVTALVQEEIARGARFAFGANWRRFLSVLNESRIRRAEESLLQMLEMSDLRGKSFLDVGSGSGLMSLVARRLGATVSSFDYDPQSVACTRELKRRYFPDDTSWQIGEGSVLDTAYMDARGRFDVAYAWGSLHHTGDIWRALDNVCRAVAPSGRLFLAIYNDQGPVSVRWRTVKRVYCSSWMGKVLVCAAIIPYWFVRGAVGDVLRVKNPLRRYREPNDRGMSPFHDWLDWLGGLPFEVAKPEAVVRFCRDRGFTLQNLTTAGGDIGNNQYVFSRG